MWLLLWSRKKLDVINYLPCICLHSDCTRTIHCTLAVDLNDAVEYWTPVPFKSFLFWMHMSNIFLTTAFDASLRDKNKSWGKTNLIGYSTCKQLEITVQCRKFLSDSLFMPRPNTLKSVHLNPNITKLIYP